MRSKDAGRRGKIAAIHPCDESHQVVTVKTKGGGAFRSSPCAECPWRRDAPIGAFPVEAYQHSARTCYDMAGHMFACHMAGATKPQTCAGFLLSRGAAHNLAVRMAMIEGRLDLDAVASDVPLYASYQEMAEANGVDPNDPALRPCRA